MIPILLYHKVINFDISGTWVTPLQFEQQMRYLYENGYTTITPYELISKGASEGSHLPSRLTTHDSQPTTHNPQLLITFDDGYVGFYEKALPTLLKYGFRATIFVVTGYIGKENKWDVRFGTKERHLNLKELQELKNMGFVIGSHTRTHPDLTQIPIYKAREEILNSKSELEDKLGEPVHFLSYPFGRYNKQVLKLAEESGYKISFTSNPFTTHDSHLTIKVLGRMGVYIIDRLADFKAKLYNGIPHTVEAKKCQLINFFSRGTWMWKTLNPFSKSCI